MELGLNMLWKVKGSGTEDGVPLKTFQLALGFLHLLNLYVLFILFYLP